MNNFYKVKFPDSLQSVTFKNYKNNQLNEKIKEIKIKYLNTSITNLHLFLERIIFLGNYCENKSIDNSRIPFDCKIIYK